MFRFGGADTVGQSAESTVSCRVRIAADNGGAGQSGAPAPGQPRARYLDEYPSS